MKNKRFSKLMIGAGLILTLGLAPLTSCSTFFGEDGFTIKEVTWQENSQGGITVTMVTTRDENPNIIFTIPAGNDGIGIKNVEATMNKEKTEVTIVISYTDTSLANTVVKVPIVHGKDGKGIKEVKVTKDVNDDVQIQFVYTDDTKSEVLTIPSGNDGNGIASIESDELSDPDFVVITIKYTDEALEPTIVKVPKGKNGISIRSIEFDESKSSDTQYCLKITYSDDYVEEVILPKPQATVWHHGESIPDPIVGKNGDYYLNVTSGFVYYKSNGAWSFIFSMDGSGSYIERNVVFHPGLGTWVNPELRDGANYTLTLKYGEYVALDEFPTIERIGYKFNGWFTGDENEVNAGQFTDLTPVQKNIDLYPRWIVE